MVEDKKKKFGIYVSSSEKTDRLARYADFCITAIPFPGTEYFTEWKEQDYRGIYKYFHLRKEKNQKMEGEIKIKIHFFGFFPFILEIKFIQY